jgi:hypothetical protein
MLHRAPASFNSFSLRAADENAFRRFVRSVVAPYVSSQHGSRRRLQKRVAPSFNTLFGSCKDGSL